MKNKIVNELITAMKARVPEKQNLAGYLADTLCMETSRLPQATGRGFFYP